MKRKNKSDLFISLWIGIGITFVLGFFVFSMIIGGSAGNGYQEAGKYFLGEHSSYIEVSKTIWTISRIWGIAFWIFVPLTPIGAFFISNIQKKIERRKNKFE